MYMKPKTNVKFKVKPATGFQKLLAYFGLYRYDKGHLHMTVKDQGVAVIEREDGLVVLVPDTNYQLI